MRRFKRILRRRLGKKSTPRSKSDVRDKFEFYSNFTSERLSRIQIRFQNRSQILKDFCDSYETSELDEGRLTEHTAFLSKGKLSSEQESLSICGPNPGLQALYMNKLAKFEFDAEEELSASQAKDKYRKSGLGLHSAAAIFANSQVRVLSVEDPFERIVAAHRRFCTEGTELGRQMKVELLDTIGRYLCVQDVIAGVRKLITCEVGTEVFERFKSSLGGSLLQGVHG